LKFLVDNQLRTALARFLAQDLGFPAIHVRDVEMESADDLELWHYAAKEKLIVVSKDEDFATLFLQDPSAKLLWVRIRNCRRRQLLEAFGGKWPQILDRFQAGESFVELR
jgi:predicted nuclease of predicted toxin-antitoxin system